MSVGKGGGQGWREAGPLPGGRGAGLTAAGLLVQEPVACGAGALKADLEVVADVGAAAVVVQTLVQPWKGTRAPEGPGAQPGVEAG